MKGSPAGDEIKAVRKGNYFKEVKSSSNDGEFIKIKKNVMKRKRSNNDDNNNNKGGGIGNNSFGSPLVSLELDEDEDEEEEDLLEVEGGRKLKKKRSSDDATNHDSSDINNDDGGAKKRLFSSDKVSAYKDKDAPYSPKKEGKMNISNKQKDEKAKKKKKMDVECIEIDLSNSSSSSDNSGDDDDDISNKNMKQKIGGRSDKHVHVGGKKFNGKLKNGKSGMSSSQQQSSDDIDSEFRSGKNKKKKQQEKQPAKKMKKQSYDSEEDTTSDDDRKKPAHNPFKKKQLKKSYNDSSDEELMVTKPAHNLVKKSSIPTMKKSYDNDSNNDNESDNNSHSSNSTIPLPEEKQSQEMKEHNQKLASSSQTKKKKGANKSRVSFGADKIDVFDNDEYDDDAEPDFSFGNEYGGFDEDEEPSSSTFNEKKKKKKSSSKGKVANKLLGKKPVLTADSDSDADDEDDKSCGSNSSAELFTPRPFKKKIEKKKQPAAATYKSEQQQTATTKSVETNSGSTSSKLLTPRAFSPATTTPTQGAYKRKVSVPTLPAISNDVIKEIGGKLYPDLRHNFILALTSHARRLRMNAYQRASFDSALRSVVVIGLHMRPLRSAEAARRLKGVGSSFYDILKDSVAGPKGKKGFAPALGKYSCVATAALVALLELEEANSGQASANGNSFPMETLLTKINQLLDTRANAALNQSAEKYLDANNLDPGWGQLKKLATNATSDLGGPFIKERKKKDACASGRIYELLDNGRDLARRLRVLARTACEPGPLRQLPDETIDEEFGSVTMSMDFREGGGGGKSLHKMCDMVSIHSRISCIGL